MNFVLANFIFLYPICCRSVKYNQGNRAELINDMETSWRMWFLNNPYFQRCFVENMCLNTPGIGWWHEKIQTLAKRDKKELQSSYYIKWVSVILAIISEVVSICPNRKSRESYKFSKVYYFRIIIRAQIDIFKLKVFLTFGCSCALEYLEFRERVTKHQATFTCTLVTGTHSLSPHQHYTALYSTCLHICKLLLNILYIFIVNITRFNWSNFLQLFVKLGKHNKDCKTRQNISWSDFYSHFSFH